MPRSLAKQLILAAALCVICLSSSRAEAQAALSFYNIAPCRAVDTRTGNGGTIMNGVTRQLQMKGICGVPLSALVVTLNLTAINPSCGGFITLWPAGTGLPLVSNINFVAAEPAIGNGAVVPIAVTSPDLNLAYGVAVPPCTVNVTLDVTGYFQ